MTAIDRLIGIGCDKEPVGRAAELHQQSQRAGVEILRLIYNDRIVIQIAFSFRYDAFGTRPELFPGLFAFSLQELLQRLVDTPDGPALYGVQWHTATRTWRGQIIS